MSKLTRAFADLSAVARICGMSVDFAYVRPVNPPPLSMTDRLNEHPSNDVDVLKLDIGGAEFQLLQFLDAWLRHATSDRRVSGGLGTVSRASADRVMRIRKDGVIAMLFCGGMNQRIQNSEPGTDAVEVFADAAARGVSK